MILARVTEPSGFPDVEERRRSRPQRIDAAASGLASQRGQVALIGFTWIVTRLAIAQDLGWFGPRTSFEDVSLYRAWATQMVHTHQLPAGTSWQYPIGAALLFLLAELGPAHYDRTFCLMMLACDLGITVTIATVGWREHRFHGVWAWLLSTTAFGPIILLRFDLAPTVALVMALAVLWSGRRLGLFGALIGVGVLVKVWPLLALVAARSWRELLRAALWCTATVVIVTAGASIFLGNALGFISNQAGRGLEVDSIAASPWFLRNAFTQKPLPFQFASGATDLAGGTASTVAAALHILMVLAAIAVAGWWVARLPPYRAPVPAGPSLLIGPAAAYVTPAERPTSPAAARDAVLTVVLWYLVISPVLSPQYFIWVMALGSLLLCSRETEMQRPLILIAVTLALTRALMQSGSQLYATHLAAGALTPTTITSLALVARNVVLLLAALDATRVVLRRGMPVPVGE